MPKSAPNPPPRLLRLRQAAEYLGRSPKAVRCMVKRGELPVIKSDSGRGAWLLDIADLNRWIEAVKITL